MGIVIATFFMTGVYHFGDYNIKEPLSTIIYYSLFASTALFAYKTFKLYSSFRKEFKRKIIKPIIKCINPDFKYSPDRHIDRYTYADSKLFPQSYNRFKGDDLIYGTEADLNFSMSELHTSLVTGSGKNRSETRVFDGLFFICDFKKKIKTETIILPDMAEKLFGKLFGQKLQSLGSGSRELIKLENPEFEKKFVVYSKDQIEARTILTPKIMEFMVKLQNKFKNRPICFSFLDNKMYFAVAYKNLSCTLFEPPIMIWKTDYYKNMKKNYDLIRIPILIAKKMHENSKIWL